jgi:hypothetical protein
MFWCGLLSWMAVPAGDEAGAVGATVRSVVVQISKVVQGFLW